MASTSWRRSIVLLALSASVAQAQSVVRIVGNDVGNATRDFVSIWLSPFDAGARDWLIAAGVVGGSALVSPWDDNVDRWAIANRDRGVLDAIRPFRRGGDFYSMNKLTPYAAGAYVLGVITKHDPTRDGIMGCLAAYGANTTIRHQFIYRIIGRDRPEPNRNVGGAVAPEPPAQHGDQYDFHFPSRTWGQHSFPGGHVANVATCASFFSHRFDWGVGEYALAGVVAVMGVGRLADRGHWLSDQIVGTAFGYAIGREVARRQLARRDRAAGTSHASPASLLLSPGDGRIGLNVTF